MFARALLIVFNAVDQTHRVRNAGVQLRLEFRDLGHIMLHCASRPVLPPFGCDLRWRVVAPFRLRAASLVVLFVFHRGCRRFF